MGSLLSRDNCSPLPYGSRHFAGTAQNLGKKIILNKYSARISPTPQRKSSGQSRDRSGTGKSIPFRIIETA